MKKITILLWLLFAAIIAEAQTASVTDSMLLANARSLANKNSKNYNPAQAATLFTTLANKGNAQAMNALGLLYTNGIGIDVDEKEGFAWCERAAKAGYARAWYNLGAMYKSGIGVEQDFNKAYTSFDQGAKLKDAYSIYGKGYCLYEGLGCKQDYSQAFLLFVRGASMKDVASMYMLGICFRNGYGTTADTAKARYWLTRAADKKYRFAIDELARPLPENTDMVKTDLNPGSTNVQPNATIATTKGPYHKIVHNVQGNDISGTYTGYQLKFDWSGKHIINYSALKVDLKQRGKNVSGQWIEGDSPATSIEAQLTDTGLVFANSQYNRKDHYNTNSPNQLQFRNGQLQWAKSGDTVYLSGNIQLYSSKQKELDKPTFIMLIKGIASNTTVNSSMTKADSVHFIAYPNPFTNVVNIKYTLKKDCNVSIVVSRLQDANIVYKTGGQLLKAGEHSNSMYLNTMPGVYVITLIYGDRIKSAMIIKN